MLIISDGQRRWAPRRPVTYAAVCIGICTHLVLTVPASAASIPSKEKQPPRATWGKARMGVTAVVLPRCAVTVSADAESAEAQPVEIRCTRDTDYALSVSSADGLEAVLHSDGQAVAENMAIAGGAGTSAYVVKNNQPTPKPKPTILSIDF